METLDKKYFSIVIIIIYCISYALLGIFPIVTFFNPALTSYFPLSIWIFLAFYVLLFVSYLLPKVCGFKYRSTDWLKLYLVFAYVQLAFFGLFVLVPIVSLTIYPIEDVNSRLFHLIWYLFFMVGVFPYFNRIKNALGMEFREIGRASLNGASAFAELAKMKLRKKEKRGLYFLTVSLSMLRGYLAHDKKQLVGLDEALSNVSTISLYGDKIPHKQLASLAEEFTPLPNLEKIPKALNKFLKSKQIAWAQDFEKIPQKRKRERISFLTEKYIVPIAMVVVTLLAIFPESLRIEIMDFFRKIEWFQLLGIVIIILLGYEAVSFFSRIIDLNYGDIKELASI